MLLYKSSGDPDPELIPRYFNFQVSERDDEFKVLQAIANQSGGQIIFDEKALAEAKVYLGGRVRGITSLTDDGRIIVTVGRNTRYIDLHHELVHASQYANMLKLKIDLNSLPDNVRPVIVRHLEREAYLHELQLGEMFNFRPEFMETLRNHLDNKIWTAVEEDIYNDDEIVQGIIDSIRVMPK